jgi:DNA-damage-inducible protein D
MERQIITKLTKSFEDYVHEREGVEFWFARDLQKLLGYDKWENFSKILEKAKYSCKNAGFNIEDHFPEVRKKVNLCLKAFMKETK